MHFGCKMHRVANVAKNTLAPLSQTTTWLKHLHLALKDGDMMDLFRSELREELVKVHFEPGVPLMEDRRKVANLLDTFADGTDKVTLLKLVDPLS